jgi:hypothetical protein
MRCRHLFVIDIAMEDVVMSLRLRAGIEFPSRLPAVTAPYSQLGLNSTGLWVGRETNGRRAGVFAMRWAA